MLSTVTTLCETTDERVKSDLIDKIRLLPLSGQTVSRRVNDLGTEIENKLKDDLKMSLVRISFG